jgi:hypothetical protein
MQTTAPTFGSRQFARWWGWCAMRQSERIRGDSTLTSTRSVYDVWSRYDAFPFAKQPAHACILRRIARAVKLGHFVVEGAVHETTGVRVETEAPASIAAISAAESSLPSPTWVKNYASTFARTRNLPSPSVGPIPSLPAASALTKSAGQLTSRPACCSLAGASACSCP